MWQISFLLQGKPDARTECAPIEFSGVQGCPSACLRTAQLSCRQSNDFFHFGRYQDHGFTFVHQLSDEAVHLLLRTHVNSAGRFVEIMISASVARTLDHATFCWLPPERFATNCSILGPLYSVSSIFNRQLLFLLVSTIMPISDQFSF